jgi:hypothetical protein
MFEHSNWFKPHLVGYYESIGVKYESSLICQGFNDR